MSQPPPYAQAQTAETDIATEIGAFTINVFNLKEEWHNTISTLKPISATASVALDSAYDRYSKFIDASQVSAMQARNSIIQAFVQTVVFAAKDPDATLEDKLDQASYLSTAISKLPKSNWTTSDTTELENAVNKVDKILRDKMRDDKLKADTALSRALDELDKLNNEHTQLQNDISDILKKESVVNKSLRFALKTLLLVLYLTPGASLRKTIVTYIDKTLFESFVELDAKIDEDEKLLKKIKTKKEVVAKLRQEKESVEGKVPEILIAQLTVQELKGNFLEIAPKLAQICILKETVGATLEDWIRYLEENKDKTPDDEDLKAYVGHLVATGNVLTPISDALAGFVGRKS